MEIFVENITQLPQVAQEIYRYAQEHRIWLFEGQMGAGKTTLIQAICQFLGVKDNVSSPTFSIINEYESDLGLIYHFDFYRIKDFSEALAIGVPDYLDSGHLCLIEWAGMIESLLPTDCVLIQINIVSEKSRTLKLSLL